MAGPDANGCFLSEADEYKFVLNNTLLWDAMFNEFGYDPVLEFGNYRQVSIRMRTQILRWVRRHDFYWDEVLGLNEEEDIEEEEEDQQEVGDDQNEVVQQQNMVEQPQNAVDQQQNVVEEQRTVLLDTVVEELNLESRIAALEIVFQQLKERKEMRERDKSGAERSGSN